MGAVPGMDVLWGWMSSAGSHAMVCVDSRTDPRCAHFTEWGSSGSLVGVEWSKAE